MAKRLSTRLLAWYDRAGRRSLPWQQTRTAYRVWLSEIMLQQTQVAIVVLYFERFATRFPDVAAMAAADLDEVLHLWSGLGYYSRARNLHKAARMVATQHGGTVPADLDGLLSLPGIGRSTAGAILALTHDRPVAILDGNVKRVLARFHAVAGWPGKSAVLKQLWSLAEDHLPQRRARDYTQALMDLGAMVCTRQRPACAACPLASDCAAHRAGNTKDFPAPKPKRELPLRTTYFLVLERDDGAVLLERRPPSGIWGGLWCFPAVDNETDTAERAARLGFEAAVVSERLPPIAHGFTHFKLHIRPLRLSAREAAGVVRDRDDLVWYSGGDSPRIGLSKPVARLLKEIHSA